MRADQAHIGRAPGTATILRVLLLVLLLGACTDDDARASAAGSTGISDAGPSDAGTTDAAVEAVDPCAAAEPRPEGPLPQTAFPRNVIILLGDGVGPMHWEAARIEAGGALAVDALEGPVLYATESLTAGAPTDSAAAATAIATGQCTENGQLGVLPGDDPGGVELANLFELARDASKRTGLVTNTFLLDASPMAFSTHLRSRSCYKELAPQLFGRSNPDLVLGGFMPDAVIGELGLDELALAQGYVVGFDLSALELAAAEAAATAPLLGLFGEGPSVDGWAGWATGLTPEVIRADDSTEPTLAELTAFALRRLAGDRDSDSDSDGGFVLFVENEHPDTVGHFVPPADAGVPLIGPLEMPSLVLELDSAVSAALDWVEANSSFDETLVVVCSDHETGGYTLPDDDSDAGVDLTAGSLPASPNHTAVDVPIYARGPGSERLHDVTHLTDVFHLLTGNLDALPGKGGCPTP